MTFQIQPDPYAITKPTVSIITIGIVKQRPFVFPSHKTQQTISITANRNHKPNGNAGHDTLEMKTNCKFKTNKIK